MSFDENEWDMAPGGTGTARFPLSRFLEYTEKSIEERFQPITESQLAFLSTIPTVFMSEIQFDNGSTRQAYVYVRTGRVGEVAIVGDEIHYRFWIEIDHGRTDILDRKAFEAAFGLGNFEIHRTHWAIKNLNLPIALHSAGITVPVPPPASASPEPPASTTPNANPVIETLQQFLSEILKLEAAPGEELFYRGHSAANYSLVPSLFRRRENGDYRWLPNEDILVRELLTAQAREFVGDVTMLDQLVRMQHYGLPTRLLDVTSNPLVALYFSCSENKEDDDGNPVDGEVIVLTTQTTDVMYFDSDTVACITNLCLLTDQQKNRLDLKLTPETFRQTADAGKLLHFIRREKPHFVDRIDPKDLSKILFVRGRVMHERISSQSGAFLLFGKDAVLPETGRSDLHIRRFTIRNKPEILKSLARLNIKASTVYPGIEKTAADIAKAYEL